MRIWSDEELEFVRTLVAQSMDTMDIYDMFKAEFGKGFRSYDSVQKKVKQFRDAAVDDLISDESDDIDDNDDDEIRLINIEEAMGGRVHRVISKTPIEVKRALKKAQPFFIDQLLEETRKHPPQVPLAPVTSKGTSLVVLLSDIHVGQQSIIYGLGKCRERLMDLPLQVYTANQHVQNIDEVVLLMIGDMVEGEDIFPTQPWHVQCSALRQVQLGTQWFWEMTLLFKELFKVPVRIICVPGNHGTVGKSSNEKTNWDNFLYLALSTVISAEKPGDISIDCDFERFKDFTVKDRRGQIYHQGTKHTGTPAMREKIAGWAYNSNVNIVCHGHWHEWHIGSWQDIIVVANGSMCGPNDLSQRMAQMTPARQGYFLVTPGRPIWGFGFAEWISEKVESDEVSFNEKKFQQENWEDPSLD